MNKACYTVITGKDYSLRDIPVKCAGWDYICFTNEKISSSDWEVRPLKPLNEYDNAKLSRKPKILCNEYLKEYDLSIYLDSKFIPIHDLDEFVKVSHRSPLTMMNHPRRRCALEELEYIGLGDSEQYEDYAESLPINRGLYAPGIMIRDHNHKPLELFLRMWWAEVAQFTHRDIPSLAYLIFITGYKDYNLLPFRETVNRFLGR